MIAFDPSVPRRSAGALIGSLLVHLLLVALVVRGAVHLGPVGDPMPLPGLAVLTRGGGGGGGGVEMRYVAVAPPAAEEPAVITPVPPLPPPEPVPVEAPLAVMEPEVRATVMTSRDTLATVGGLAGPVGIGPGAGGGSGGGIGTGQGTGSGGGAGPGEGGEGGRAVPPEPRQMIIPPDFPRSMRGLQVTVIFDVGVDGRVRQVEFEPGVPDRGYARRLEAVMRDYRFRPARDETGRDVPGVARVVLSF